MAITDDESAEGHQIFSGVGALMDRIEWAREKADWSDPISEAIDEPMKGIDRE